MYLRILVLVLSLSFVTGCSLSDMVKNKNKTALETEKIILTEAQLAQAIAFCKQNFGSYALVGENKYCILNSGVRVDLVDYYQSNCAPLGSNCSAALDSSRPGEVKDLQTYVGTIYSLPLSSGYNNYIVIENAIRDQKLGIDDDLPEEIKTMILKYTDTEQQVEITGYIIENNQDVGGKSLVVSSIKTLE